MSVYYYKESGNNMVIQATLQTKLACATLMILIVNVCFLIAVIAFISKNEMCRINNESNLNSSEKLLMRKKANYLLTSIKENPWMLAFIIFPERVLVGTASIISKNWAITTSYCVYKVSNCPISKKAFRGGSSFWNKNGNYHFIKKLIPHEKFDPGTLDYNIALAQVERPFINHNEVPISITGNYELIDGSPARVVGWPIRIKHDKDYCLIKSNVKLISEHIGSQLLVKIKNNTIASRLMCTTAMKNQTGSCIFASGGTVIVNKSIIGLVSWDINCSKNHSPDIFVYFKQFYEWILEIKIKEDIPLEI